MNFPKLGKKTIALIVVAALALVSIAIFAKFDGISRTAADKETGLMGLYETTQVELNNYANGLYESVNIADRKSDKLDQIMKDAISGRYGDTPGRTNGTGGSFFSALTEAYPDLTSNLDVYDQIASYAMTERKAYSDEQKLLVDRVRDYKKWLTSGILDKQLISMAGYPSDNLTVTVDGSTYSGADAIKAIIDYNAQGTGVASHGKPILP